MYKKFIVIFLGILVLSCGKDNNEAAEIEQIPVDLKIERFDQRFAQATADSLPTLKRDFSYLFPRQYPDILWVEKMQDSIQLELNEAVSRAFPNFERPSEDIKKLFRHIKYYFPQQKEPKVITLTSDVDYRNPVIWADSLVLVGLDNYLGSDNKLYFGLQEYIKKHLRKEQLVPDIAAAFAKTVVPRPQSRSFLHHMIYYGKVLYLKEKLLPFLPEAERMKYLPEELDWAQANETQIWRYFVEKELLFSSDAELQTRFLYPAPFSKFYLELDAEAPPRLGQFIGLQIVRQYMEKTDSSLQELLQEDAETIFKQSNYKPRK